MPFVPRPWSRARWLAILCASSLCVAAGGTAHAAPPSTPESRLLSVWLDLQLVAIFYPDTTAETLLPNLGKVAAQLGQPLPPIRFGETVRDAHKHPIGAVMIKQHPPPDTWILYTRSRSHVWKLIDDPQGRLQLMRLASP